MNREIKYRAWDLKSLKMRDVTFIRWTSAGVRYVEMISNTRRTGASVILLQYTGLKDDDSIKIYEHDIIQDADGAVAVVRYIGTEFVAMDITPTGACNLLGWPCKVIGNEFQNPDLIQQYTSDIVK